MLVYILPGAKTALAPVMLRGLPLWRLTVGSGCFARRRAAGYLRRLYASGVRRGIFADAALAATAARQGIHPLSVLPLRLALLDKLLDTLAVENLRHGAVCLHCGEGGEETARCAAAMLVHRARYLCLEGGDRAALTSFLLRGWGVSPGSGGRPVSLTVCTGHTAPTIGGAALCLTDDCERLQRVAYDPPDLPEPLLAALVEAGKCRAAEIRVISVTSSLDRRRESYYNAT